MAESSTRVLLGLALVGITVLFVQQWRLGSRVEALHDLHALLQAELPMEEAPVTVRSPEAPVSAPRPSLLKPKAKGRKLKLRGKAVADGPSSEGGRLARRRDRIRARTAKLKLEFETFAQEHGIDAGTGTAVLDELQLAREAMALVRVDLHEDRVSPAEAHTEIEGIRIDTDAALVELVGQETTTALHERLAPWLDREEEPE